MAAALRCSASFGGHHRPIRSVGMQDVPAAFGLSRLPALYCPFPSEPPCVRSSAVILGRPPCALHHALGKHLQDIRPCLERRLLLRAASAALPDSNQSGIDVESVKDDLEIETSGLLKSWQQFFESAKALKMRSLSQEAYDIYSERARVVLKEASRKIKIHADQARKDFTNLAEEIRVEGRKYLSTYTKTYPEPIKDVLETFSSSIYGLKDVSGVRDFHVGIPYGCLLATGGFLHFMLTESIPAVRFGIILGCALLALSILSLKAWKNGQPAVIFLKGQAGVATPFQELGIGITLKKLGIAIAGIIFIREWNLLIQKLLFPSFLSTILSGAMLVFYAYRLMIDGLSEGPRSGAD